MDITPTILKDCHAFAKGCEDCQKHAPVQRIPNEPLQPIIKPWPARGWALDFVGEIHPHSSLQHKYILLGTDFHTKWVEAVPTRNCDANTVIRFIFQNIICRYGISECLVADRGAAFMAEKTQGFLADYGIKFLHSTPYYAQSNGQAEATNKTIISILKKMLDDNPRAWHTQLDNTLWAYRTSKRTPTDTTPYALMYGHDAVLPIEINVCSLRVREQHQLLGEDYVQAMFQEHEDLDEKRLEALNNIILEKKKIARLYDKRTKGRTYGEGDLVWKAMLPLDAPGKPKFEPRWEGPFVIDRIVGRGAYQLMSLEGEPHPNPINGRYLKKYLPGVWEFEDPEPGDQAEGQTDAPSS